MYKISPKVQIAHHASASAVGRPVFGESSAAAATKEDATVNTVTVGRVFSSLEMPFTLGCIPTLSPCSRVKASSHPSSNNSAFSEGSAIASASFFLPPVTRPPFHAATAFGTQLQKVYHIKTTQRDCRTSTYLGEYVLANNAASGARSVFSRSSTHAFGSPSCNNDAKARLFCPFPTVFD